MINCGDVNMYPHTDNGVTVWVVEFYGIGGDLVEKSFYGSVEAARVAILQWKGYL